MWKLNKRGQVTFGSLSSIILVVGIASVIGVVMAILLSTIRSSSTTTNDVGYNISTNTLNFFNNLASQWGLLGTVIGLVLVVSIVIAVFRFRGAGGGV